MATRNKGDAEAARATRREKITAAIEPGAFVESIYGVRRVLKVNAKTLRLQGDGSNVTIDKALCTVVPECCGTCESWQAPTAPETEGGCWSPDRLDGDLTKGPAGYTLATSGCEAWMPRGLRHRYEWPRTALRLSQGETQAARLAREERTFAAVDTYPYTVGYVATEHGVVGVYHQPGLTVAVLVIDGIEHRAWWKRSFSERHLITVMKRFAAGRAALEARHGE